MYYHVFLDCPKTRPLVSTEREDKKSYEDDTIEVSFFLLLVEKTCLAPAQIICKKKLSSFSPVFLPYQRSETKQM